MINEKSVIRMKVPFPDVDSGLAMKAHMYVCTKAGSKKEFIKCTSFKPRHFNLNVPPYNRITEDVDPSRNPFSSKTILDCDKSFLAENVVVDTSLLTTKRPDVCDDLFTEIENKVSHSQFSKKILDTNELMTLNTKISNLADS